MSAPKLGVLFPSVLASLVGLIKKWTLVFRGLGVLTSRAKAHSIDKLSGMMDFVGESIVCILSGGIFFYKVSTIYIKLDISVVRLLYSFSRRDNL